MLWPLISEANEFTRFLAWHTTAVRMSAHFGGGVAARPHGLEPGVEDRIRRQRGRGAGWRRGSYSTAAFHSVKHETTLLNRQYSGESAQTQWPPLPQSPPLPLVAPAPTPFHFSATHQRPVSFNDNNDSHADLAPDMVPYGVGMTVSNAQLCAAFGPSPIFQVGAAPGEASSFSSPDEELEMMKSLSLVDMIRVMQGAEVTQIAAINPPVCPQAPRLSSGAAPPLPPRASGFALPTTLFSTDPPVPRGCEGFASSVA